MKAWCACNVVVCEKPGVVVREVHLGEPPRPAPVVSPNELRSRITALHDAQQPDSVDCTLKRSSSVSTVFIHMYAVELKARSYGPGEHTNKVRAT